MDGSPDDSGDEMHHQVAWMRPSDRSIVKEISDYGGWIKPASLTLNLPYTRNHIAARCRELSDHGLLERHEDTAAYRATDKGREFLADKLEPSDLLDDSDDEANGE